MKERERLSSQASSLLWRLSGTFSRFLSPCRDLWDPHRFPGIFHDVKQRRGQFVYVLRVRRNRGGTPNSEHTGVFEWIHSVHRCTCRVLPAAFHYYFDVERL